ncbi:MAG TPA: hypothetical protein DIT32_03480 [Peptococcaceae bacterium]|nr:hypothetical protein [Peptococcaceae bacterium]
MTYDQEISLIADSDDPDIDDIGDMKESQTQRTVYVAILNYRTKAYYQALSNGMRPEIVFAINKYEYNDEKTMIYDGKTFRILDVSQTIAKYASEYESLTLICTAVI